MRWCSALKCFNLDPVDIAVIIIISVVAHLLCVRRTGVNFLFVEELNHRRRGRNRMLGAGWD